MSAEDDLWAAVGVAPGLPFDPATRRLLVLDQRRWSRRWLYPWVRPLSRLIVTLIVVAKRVLPVRGTAHSTKTYLRIDQIHRKWIVISRDSHFESSARCGYVDDKHVAFGLLHEGANNTINFDPLAVKCSSTCLCVFEVNGIGKW